MAIAAAARSALAPRSLLFYLAAYAVTNLGAFAVVTALPQATTLDSYRGLARRHPGLAAGQRPPPTRPGQSHSPSGSPPAPSCRCSPEPCGGNRDTASDRVLSQGRHATEPTGRSPAMVSVTSRRTAPDDGRVPAAVSACSQ